MIVVVVFDIIVALFISCEPATLIGNQFLCTA